MLSNSSTRAKIFALCLALLEAGCGGRPESASVPAPLSPSTASSKTLPSRWVWVSTVILERRHPLQRDVSRLANAEQRLRQLETAPRLVTENKQVILPPLRPDTFAPAADTPEIAVLRARLEKNALRRAAKFTRQLRERGERTIARRRAELLAALQNRLLLHRLQVQALGLLFSSEKLSQLALLSTNLTIQRDAITANLRSTGAISDSAKVEREVALLKQNPDALYVSDQGRFEFALLGNAEARSDVDARIAVVRADVAAWVARLAAAEQTRLLADVDRQVGLLRQTLMAGRDNGARASRLLTAFADAEKSIAERERTVLPGATAYTRQIVLGGAVDSSSVLAAADRIRAQKQRLQQFIRADVKQAVLDAGKARNVRVEFGRAGLPDATTEAMGWLNAQPEAR